MITTNIILLILKTFLIFSLCEEHPIDTNDLIIKGIGTDEINVTNYGLEFSDFVYYDLDLYPNQFIQIDLSKSKEKIKKIEPISDKKFYTTVTNPSSPETSLTRTTNDIEYVASLEVEIDDDEIKIYYDDFNIPESIITMYFDCINDKNQIVATIQINVMPEIENISNEEMIVLGEEPYDKFKDALYLKEVRHGSLLEMYCMDVDPDHEPPSHGFTNNPISKIDYEVVDDNYFSEYEPFTETFVLDLRDDVIFKSSDVKKITCEEGNFKNIYFKKFEYDKFSGYNNGMSRYNVTVNEVENYFDLKNKQIVSIDVPRYYLHPMDCLRDFIDPFFNIIQIKDYFRGSKLTNISKSIKILDTSRVSSYNTISLGCKYEGTSTTPDMYFHTQPSCDLTKVDNLGKDKVSCTMFINPSQTLVNIYKTQDLKIREEKLGFNTYYLENDEVPTLESEFKSVDSKDISNRCITLTEYQTNIVVQQKQRCEIKYNPMYILMEDKDKNLKRFVRIYAHNNVVINKRNYVIPKIAFLKPLDSRPGIHYIGLAHKRISIKCDEYFEKGSTLYPKGKNSVFRFVNNEKHPSEIESVQIEDIFGTNAINIYKRPETKSDLEIVVDEDYEITSDHFRPMYFMCVNDVKPEEWRLKSENYSVIAIDPMYKNVHYKGCGMKPELFVDANGEQNTQTDCEFDLLKHENVRFHCPDYVPEHFMGDNQEKFEADEDQKTKVNPYQSLVRCYDRTTFFARLFKFKNEVDVLKKRKSVSEIRSMWQFDEDLMEEQNLTTVVCVCYNKKGEPKAKIKVRRGPQRFV